MTLDDVHSGIDWSFVITALLCSWIRSGDRPCNASLTRARIAAFLEAAAAPDDDDDDDEDIATKDAITDFNRISLTMF